MRARRRLKSGWRTTMGVLTSGASSRPLLSTPEQAAVFASAARVPVSFERSLMPRPWADQGLVSGVSMTATYGVTVLAQEAIDAAVARLAARIGLSSTGARMSTGAANLAALGFGLLVRRLLPWSPRERLARSVARTSAEEIARGGFAGVAAALTLELIEVANRKQGRVRLLADPTLALSGALTAMALELRRRRRYAAEQPENAEQLSASVGRALGAASGVAAGITLVSAGERSVASRVDRVLTPVLPGLSGTRRLSGHAASLALVAGGVYGGLHLLYRRIEEGAGKPEPGLDLPPASPYASGGPKSVVAFDTLGREGRRHVLSAVHPDWIRSVMGQDAVAEPVSIYVGLDSASTIEDRVRLALAEVDRTGALDRSLLILVTPTGTGYVNYAAMEAAAYLTLGDLATVTLQYSKRPSPMSLDRVALGREQNRALWLAIHERLYQRPPERRPRVALFGESLGAHTSQDVFLHWGTAGMRALGIDRALWLGTPYASGWKDEVLGPPRPDVERAAVGVFARFADYAALPVERRADLRYVMLTHGDDPIAYFGLDLLVRRPVWLGHLRPAGVPTSMRWVPMLTFAQVAADMKNAMHVVPGEFVAEGHDYRADIAQFVRAAYGLSATDEQMGSIDTALRRFERKLFGTIEDARSSGTQAAEEAVRVLRNSSR